MRHLEHALLATVVGFVALAGARSRGDDPLPEVDDEAPPAAQRQDAPDSPSAKKSGEAAEDDSVADKLLRALDPVAQGLQAEIEKMERAIESMRRASERIGAADTGAETRALQERVIQDLEELLKRLQARQQNPRQNQPQSQNPDQQQQRQRLAQPQPDPQNSGRRQPRAGRNQPQRSDADHARDAQERLDPARARPAEEARRAQWIKDVWGHLPPQLREALQQSYSEKYLPRYEDLVKRYYEALAEKNRKRPAF